MLTQKINIVYYLEYPLLIILLKVINLYIMYIIISTSLVFQSIDLPFSILLQVLR